MGGIQFGSQMCWQVSAFFPGSHWSGTSRIWHNLLWGPWSMWSFWARLLGRTSERKKTRIKLTKHHETWLRRKDTLEDSRRHEKTRDRGRDREATRGAWPALRPASLAKRPTAFHFAWHNPTDFYVVFWPLIQVGLIRGLRFILPDYITRPRTPWGIHHHKVKTRLELGFPERD
jgi:hypothetical protein